MKRRTKSNIGQWPNMRACTLKAIAEELVRARAKHPHRGAHIGLAHNYLAEIERAISEHRAGRQSAAQVFAAAATLAVMAVRIMEEGSIGFPYANHFSLPFKLEG